MTCFVILHYLVSKETINTVNSILKNVNGELAIVVVDNCSPNDSFDVITQAYINEPRVKVIKNETNAGYARGINFGYDYAKEHYHPSFIVAMNNDMEIRQNDFLTKMNEIYKETDFYVLGPDVYSTSAEKHQNPENDHIRTLAEIDEHIKSVMQTKNHTLKLKIKGMLRRSKLIYNFYYGKKKAENQKNYVNTRQSNVTLHGSCLIFSELFIAKRAYALFPGTEFYCEAQILDYECLRDCMLQIYDPSLKIYHHEDVATDAVAGSYSAKMVKKCERVLTSLKLFRQLMLEDQKKWMK